MCSTKTETCPLCFASEQEAFWQDEKRNYLLCQVCDLVFVPTRFHLDPVREKAQYDLHQNSPDDPGYRKFLSRMASPLNEMLRPSSKGLDFGCGPGPTLSAMFQEMGHDVEVYDKFYFPNESLLSRQYDFITVTEVVEHLVKPGQVLSALWDLIRPGGHLGIMTKLHLDRQAFSGWHYKNDPTHISFFSLKSLEFLQSRLGAELSVLDKDVFIYKRSVL